MLHGWCVRRKKKFSKIHIICQQKVRLFQNKMLIHFITQPLWKHLRMPRTSFFSFRIFASNLKASEIGNHFSHNSGIFEWKKCTEKDVLPNLLSPTKNLLKEIDVELQPLWMEYLSLSTREGRSQKKREGVAIVYFSHIWNRLKNRRYFPLNDVGRWHFLEGDAKRNTFLMNGGKEWYALGAKALVNSQVAIPHCKGENLLPN